MARDLCSDVEKLLSNSNSYVRKKAALCALRIIKKVPELIENFVERATSLLNERNHGVLLTGITLLTEICVSSPQALSQLRKSTFTFVKHLKNLSSSGFSPEHDVGGITDPFLQIKLLKMLRILGKGDAQASDAMNDVLAQVATNTEATKNVGNAILYETVLTIMEIEADNSLRVMAINILGKFLGNKDNNIRYVSLTTLARTSSINDASALQRHRSTILECLRDPDISIRRRALDLAFILINSQNVRLLTRELLSFLEVCETDIKASVASRICEVAGRYRPNKRWEVDTLIRVLRVAGEHVDQSLVNSFVKLVSTGTDDLLVYSTSKLYHLTSDDNHSALKQQALVVAAVWCLGEYGDLLVSGGNSDMSRLFVDEDEPSANALISVDEKQVLDWFDEVLSGPYATLLIKEYSLNSLMKLMAKYSDSTRIKTRISQFKADINLELQQISTEASVIAGLDSQTRFSLMERLPVLETAEKEEAKKGTGVAFDESLNRVANRPSSAKSLANQVDDLLSLMGDPVSTATQSVASNNNSVVDLLGGLGFDSGSSAVNSNTLAQRPPADPLAGLFAQDTASKPQPSNSLGGLFGATETFSHSQTAPVVSNESLYSVYSKNNLDITLSAARVGSNGTIDLVATFKNLSVSSCITDILFQVAVPKTLVLQMKAPSSTVVQPGSSATQLMRIENPSKVQIKLRMKLSFTMANGGQVKEMLEYSAFDSQLWA